MSQSILRLLRGGGPPTVDQWNRLVRYCARKITGVGCRVRDMDDGISIEVVPGGATSPVDAHRFKIKQASTTSEGVTTPKITLVPGVVDDQSPVIGAVTIDTVPAPALTLSNSVKNIIVLKATYTADTTTVGGATILMNNGTISDPEIIAYADGSVPDDVDPTDSAPEGTYYTRIGYATVNGNGAITDITNDGVRTSLVSHFCATSGSMYYSMI